MTDKTIYCPVPGMLFDFVIECGCIYMMHPCDINAGDTLMLQEEDYEHVLTGREKKVIVKESSEIDIGYNKMARLVKFEPGIKPKED